MLPCLGYCEWCSVNIGVPVSFKETSFCTHRTLKRSLSIYLLSQPTATLEILRCRPPPPPPLLLEQQQTWQGLGNWAPTVTGPTHTPVLLGATRAKFWQEDYSLSALSGINGVLFPLSQVLNINAISPNVRRSTLQITHGMRL